MKTMIQSEFARKYGRIYIDNADGTVTDESTGLMWKRQKEECTYEWDEAVDVFNGQTPACCFAGYSDWRLPTLEELATLLLSEREAPFFCEEAFPDGKSWFWSAKHYSELPGYAWYVHFGSLGMAYNNRYDCYDVRLVRKDTDPSALAPDGADSNTL